MGTKTVKFGHGMIMLVKAIMDEELFELISSNIYVGSFGDSEVITDRDGILVSFNQSYNQCTTCWVARLGWCCAFTGQQPDAAKQHSPSAAASYL